MTHTKMTHFKKKRERERERKMLLFRSIYCTVFLLVLIVDVVY